MHAGPVVMLRLLDHRGANRIELDIVIGGKKISTRIDQTGLETSFPQRSGAPMATVEGSDLGLALWRIANDTWPDSSELMRRCTWSPIRA